MNNIFKNKFNRSSGFFYDISAVESPKLNKVRKLSQMGVIFLI